MRNRILKVARVLISLVFLILTGFLFLDFAGTLTPSWINRITWIQFIPSLLNFINPGSVFALGFLVVIITTLLFGRVYCSTVCPLGILQDVISFVSKLYKRKIRGKRIRYRRSRPQNLLRYSILAVTVVFFLSGSVFFLNMLDPFSLFGKIFSGGVRPLYYGLNNILADIFLYFGSYRFYHMDIQSINMLPLLFPAFMLGLVILLSFTRGRLYCNTVCPVGSFLGLISKFSVYRIRIDENLCNNCAKCSLHCKAGCIDLKTHEVDFSRCVGCFNCLDVCSERGIDYENRWFPKKDQSKSGSEPVPEFMGNGRFGKEPERLRLPTAVARVEPPDNNRRNFIFQVTACFAGYPMATGILNANAVPQDARREDLDVEVTEPTTIPEEKSFPVAPPGAQGLQYFNEACTACHLCVSACPSNVLQPSFLEYGFTGMMRPRMDYHASYCNFDCVVCTEICPTGALLPLTKEEKHVTQIGVVQLELENCVVKTEHTACGACAEHCPTQAVEMAPYREGLTIPEIEEDYCIGCGACEYICPTRPYRAIYVDGIELHAEAEPPEIEELDHEESEDGFAF